MNAPYLRCSYISSKGSETFCESAHENINVLGINVEQIHNSFSMWSQSPDAVGLINVQITLQNVSEEHLEIVPFMGSIEQSKKSKLPKYLVFLLEANYFRQMDDGPFHRVSAFNYNDNFLPWSELPWPSVYD